MNIKENVYTMKFKDMAKELNELAKTVETYYTTSPYYIKKEIFDTIKRTYRQLEIRNIDVNYNKIKITIPFQHTFQGIENYDSGHISLIFSIRTKRTDTLEEISKTKKKYVHTKHDNPITFSGYGISSWTASFEWRSRELNELHITRTGSTSNKEVEKIVKKQTIQEVLDAIPETYSKEFRLAIVQPYVHAIFARRFNDTKYQVIYDAAPSYVKEAIDTEGNIFDAVADYIIKENLIAN